MQRPLILAAPLVVGGTCRVEVASFLAWASAWQASNPDKILDLYLCPEQHVPAPVARNRVVKIAQERHADAVLFIDDDMVIPPEFFAFGVEFIRKHQGPCVLGVPYATSPTPAEEVLAFEWVSAESNTPNPRWKLERIRREDAARRTGVERVANLGTGAVFITLDCFSRVPRPYFDYSYKDESHTEVIETEDCYFFRKCDERGIPLYVSWDHWAGHAKTKIVGKPVVIGRKDVGEFYTAQARAELEREQRSRDSRLQKPPSLLAEAHELLPQDVPGWCDFQELYAKAVMEARDGAHFVEVGAWLGQSAILMARLIERSGKLIAFSVVDTFEGSPDEALHQKIVAEHGGSVRYAFEGNCLRYGVLGYLGICQGESTEVARRFSDDDLDFVFLDAGHSREAVLADIKAWQGKVRPGGLLAGHDIDFPGMRQAVECLLPDFTIEGRCWLWRRPAAEQSNNTPPLEASVHGD